MGCLEPGPVAPHFVGIEPLAVVPVLSLPGDPLPQQVHIRLIGRGLENSSFPEPDIDAGGFSQLLGLVAVELPACDSQLEHLFAQRRVDLGRQHSGRRPPGLARFLASLDDPDPAAEPGDLASARCPHHASTDDDNLRRTRHLDLDETF
jgi:hypothetical protein